MKAFKRYLQIFRHTWFGSEWSVIAWIFFILPFVFHADWRFRTAAPFMMLFVPLLVWGEIKVIQDTKKEKA